MPSTLTVGSSPDCDVPLAAPSVSGRHCKLTREGDAVFLEDLGSRNGTYLNGERLEAPARAVITDSDAIHLGSHRLDLGPLLARLAAEPVAEDRPRLLEFTAEAAVIGRVAGNDVVIDLPAVSSRHARLTRSGADIIVEDLGSSNGTYVDGRRIDGPTTLERSSILSLGSTPFRLSEASWRPAPASFEWSEDATTSPVGPATAILAAGTLAAALAPLAAPAGPARLFALAVGAVAIGGVDALAATILRPPTGLGRGTAGVRTAGLVAALGLVQAQFLWLAGRWLGDVQGQALAAVLVLSSTIFAGAAGAFAAFRLAPGSRPARWATVAGLVVAAGLLGGFAPAATDLPPALRPALGISPARWAFEGLMLASPPGNDMAERYFPAATDRMGLAADCTALALWAFGFAGVAAMRRPGHAGAYPSFLTA